MLPSVLFLQASIILMDFIPSRVRWVIPFISMALLQYTICVHPWPYGIEYSKFDLCSWVGFAQIIAAFLVAGLIKISSSNRRKDGALMEDAQMKSNLSRGLCAILLATIQVLRGTDWFNMYVGLEILLVATMLLSQGWNDKKDYLRLQVLATTLILIGIGQFYVEHGHFGLGRGSPLLFLGLVIKGGFWPFNNQLNFYRNGSLSLFIALTCIISKVSLFCLAQFIDSRQYTALFATSFIASCYLCLRSKNVKELSAPIILASNAIFLIFMNYTGPIEQISYLLYSVLTQLCFCSKYSDLSLLVAYAPLGVDLMFKVMLLRNLCSPYIQGMIVFGSAVMCSRVCYVVLKHRLRSMVSLNNT